MSGNAQEASPSRAGSGEQARAFHAAAAIAAALSLAVLFAWDWSCGLALPNPLPAILIAMSLAVGAGCARMIALRLERVRGIPAVAALLRIANPAESGQLDGMDGPPGPSRSRRMLNVMSLQIVLTGAAGWSMLLVLVWYHGTSAGLDAWPGVASIVLLEAMYIAWLAEGMAAADELSLLARRWVRSGQSGFPSPAVVRQRPSTDESFAGRARFLGDVLARYGVDLNADEEKETGHLTSAPSEE